MEYKIIEKPEMKFVGVEIVTSMKEMEKENPYPALWEKFIPRVDEVKNRVDENVLYGPSVMISWEEGTFRALAAAEVSSFDFVPEGMKTMTIPASKYASFEYKGKVVDLGDTYEAIMKQLKEDGVEVVDATIEYYGPGYVHDSDDSVMEIWVAIK